MRKLELAGQVFGGLTVLEENGRSSDGKVMWLCKCECGNLTTVRSGHLRRSKIKSCGCKQWDHAFVHGRTSTRTYQIWASMKSRCYCSTAARFESYGGRGIYVCDRWLNSFENFLADMGEAPENCSIDRIDVNGNYEPSNCRWATPREQGNNRRTNILITWQGKTQSLTQWAEEMSISRDVIKRRLEQGRSIDRLFEL